MIDIGAECPRLLAQAGIVSADISSSSRRILAFEGATVLGFVLIYSNAEQLLRGWQSDAESLITAHQLSLRRAQSKAWNTYVVLLAGESPTYAELIALNAIEEDLTGTRKLARAGIANADDVRTALLPLLPIQNAPRLEDVNMPTEIQLRTTELPSRAVEAFLSSASVAAVAQTLEELP